MALRRPLVFLAFMLRWQADSLRLATCRKHDEEAGLDAGRDDWPGDRNLQRVVLRPSGTFGPGCLKTCMPVPCPSNVSVAQKREELRMVQRNLKNRSLNPEPFTYFLI